MACCSEFGLRQARTCAVLVIVLLVLVTSAFAQQGGANAPEAGKLTLANDLISSDWTTRGAALVDAKLLRFKAPYELQGKRTTLTLLHDIERGIDSMVIESVTVEAGGGQPRTIPLADTVYRLVPAGAADTLVFEHKLDDGLLIRKSVRLPAGKYDFEIALTFENKSAASLTLQYRLRALGGIEPETLPPNQVGPVWGIQAPKKLEIKRHWASQLAKQPVSYDGPDVRWAGLQNHYFVAIALLGEGFPLEKATASLIVDTNLEQGKGRWAPGRVPDSLEKPGERKRFARTNGAITLTSERIELTPGASTSNTLTLIAAPKRDSVLKPYGVKIEELQQFTLFRAISRALLWVLNLLHSFIPNYGLCILVVTFLIKLALHPLSKKGQISMARMQLLTPELERLRDKYGDDKKRLGAEQWALYKRYNISPFSGCLPMFIQLPIFIGLFGALRASIDLRQASFLWIADLSRPDTVARLPFEIPLLGTDAVNPLPVLYVISSLISSALQPKAQDRKSRQQQQLMAFLPVVIGFILYKVPSGLMLYWTASNVMGIFEQWQIRKHVQLVKEAPLSAHEPADAPQKRGGLRGTLSRMMDAQARKIRRRGGREDD